MRWTYDGTGGWFAESKLTDKGVTLMYQIEVCDDGTFDVNGSSPELVGDCDTFPTLDAAKAFCAGNERDLDAEGA